MNLQVLKSEPQNIEYRRVVPLRSVIFIKQTEFNSSIFDIHYSIFAFLSFY